MKKSVLFVPFFPACFAVAALCSPIQAYSIEPATPNDEALISSVVSTDDDSIEADGAFGKDSLGSTGDAGDITPDDAQTPAAGDDEADTSSPAPDVSAEPSAPPSNPQISDFPAADIDEGVYEISNAGSNRVLDVSGGSCDNRANVQQYGQNGTPAQRWRIEKFNGHYLLVNVASGKALDVSGGNGANGTNVQQYALNHTNAQLWDFIARQDGGYFIKSCLGDYVLDISGGSVANGGNAQVYSWNATNAQVWNLVKIAQTIDDGL